MPKDLKVIALDCIIDEKRNRTLPAIEDNVRNAKQNRCTALDKPIETRQLALWLNKNAKHIENTKEFVVGEGNSRLYLGPVLRGIIGYSHAEISGRDIQFFSYSAINNGKAVEKKEKKMFFTTTDNSKDLLVLVVKNRFADYDNKFKNNSA